MGRCFVDRVARGLCRLAADPDTGVVVVLALRADDVRGVVVVVLALRVDDVRGVVVVVLASRVDDVRVVVVVVLALGCFIEISGEDSDSDDSSVVGRCLRAVEKNDSPVLFFFRANSRMASSLAFCSVINDFRSSSRLPARSASLSTDAMARCKRFFLANSTIISKSSADISA